FEQQINPVIMERGRDYANNGLVNNLEETETDFWQAWVEGSDTYDVEIGLQGRQITHYSCTCPYDQGPVCKHVAATLLLIARQENSPANSAPKQKKLSKAAQLSCILEQLERSELEQYIRETLRDRHQLNAFLLRYQHLSGSREPVAKRFRQQFESIARKHADRGFIDYRSARHFSTEVDTLLDNLALVPSPNDRMEACYSIAEALASDIANAIDDSDGTLGGIMHQMTKILETAWPQLSATERQHGFEQVLRLRFNSELDNYGLADELPGLTRSWASHHPEFREPLLQTLTRVSDKPRNEWQYQSLLREKVKLLQDWDRGAEAMELARTHAQIPELRRLLVDQALTHGDSKTAKALVEEGIRIATQQRHPGTVNQWHQKLLEIARQDDDLPAIRSYLETLLQNNRFELGIFRQLKATYPAAEWPAMWPVYYRKMLDQNINAASLAAILDAENELENLFKLVLKQEQGAIHLLRQYTRRLATAFPEEMVATWVRAIRIELRQAGKTVYQQAAKDLQQLATLPGGKAAQQELLQQLRQEYKNRRAMLTIFDQALGKA
ncbi:MAG: SWIM zinc finger family protein, partial [Thiothrix sp.]|nr:SWIM zinc finger family protein [Thiothrix sp.]